MFEKVNPSHPDKVADRIAGADVDGIPYSKIVGTARAYIRSVGGFEKFAEWGLV